MKKFLLLFFLFPLVYQGSSQTTIEGIFFSDTTLTLKKSPYHVTKNVLVPKGVSVKIEPGVVIYFDQDISWTIEGEFQAVGTLQDSIKFLSQNGDLWGGIIYNSSATPYDATNKKGCILDYCIIRNGSNVTTNGATIYIFHSEISYCDQGIIAYGSDIQIRHTHLHHVKYGAFSTYYGSLFPLPVIVDSCELNNINTSGNDAIRLTANVLFSNNCVHDNASEFILSVFEGPNIEVRNNNFYNNNGSALVLIDGPDSTVKIVNNDFTNNAINILKPNCYSTPIITGNNFYSYKKYNIYCTTSLTLGGPVCRSIPNASFYTLDMKKNYFAHKSTAELENSIYDLYDNWTGRTIIAYDSTILTPYANNLNCETLFDIPSSTRDIRPLINSLTLYPNPFSNQLNIRSTERGNFELIIYDMLSREILQQQFTNETTINTSTLLNGIYIYEIRNKNETVQKGKLVKD